jgi:hypothetical protein
MPVIGALRRRLPSAPLNVASPKLVYVVLFLHRSGSP